MTDENKSALGGCLCGAVRYRVTGRPTSTSLCHCRSCRLATGGPALAWAIFEEDLVQLEQGTLTVYASSEGVERGFCGTCGTSLTYRRATRPGLFDVTTASLDDPDAFPPTKQIWCEERLAWMDGLDGLPQFPRFSTNVRQG